MKSLMLCLLLSGWLSASAITVDQINQAIGTNLTLSNSAPVAVGFDLYTGGLGQLGYVATNVDTAIERLNTYSNLAARISVFDDINTDEHLFMVGSFDNVEYTTPPSSWLQYNLFTATNYNWVVLNVHITNQSGSDATKGVCLYTRDFQYGSSEYWAGISADRSIFLPDGSTSDVVLIGWCNVGSVMRVVIDPPFNDASDCVVSATIEAALNFETFNVGSLQAE